MHLNIETVWDAFKFPLGGQANRKSDSVMIQNTDICLLMQFKMSKVKYSERNYLFKPFGAPGRMAGICRHTGSGSCVAGVLPQGPRASSHSSNAKIFLFFSRFLVF